MGMFSIGAGLFGVMIGMLALYDWSKHGDETSGMLGVLLLVVGFALAFGGFYTLHEKGKCNDAGGYYIQGGVEIEDITYKCIERPEPIELP